MLVSIRIPSDQSIATTSRQINELRKGVDRLAYGGDVRITGFDVLMAKEFTHLINQLRISLLIAIFLGVAVIGVTTRSLFMTVIALTPNLLPIFSVELIVWLRGGTINMSEVIALTIAFGIAIDIAVHLINVYKTELDAGTEQVTAMNRAMEEVGAAMAASTAILCIATLVTQISDLPVVPSVGGLIIATLVVAYFSNLLILPANMLTLRRFFGRMERNKAKSAAGAE